MRKLWIDLRSAILFITILPAGKGTTFSATGMIRFFPVVGLVLGSFLLIFDLLVSMFWPPSVVALLDVLLLVVLTGAFHLDGLGDTADGLFSHRSRKRALEIMKDSRTGMMGLVAVFCGLAVKVAGIYSVKSACAPLDAALLLLIVPAYARSGMLVGIRYFKYGRTAGTGHDLFEKRLPYSNFVFFLLPFSLSWALGARGLLLNGVFILSLFLMLLFYKKKMGAITGDMLGALCEVTESVLFLGAGASLFS